MSMSIPNPPPCSLQRIVITCGLKQEEKRRGNSAAVQRRHSQNIMWAPRKSQTNARKSFPNKAAKIRNPQKRSAKTVVQTLIESIHERHWQNALKVFGMLREQSWYEPNINTYRKLLVLLGRCGQPDQAHSLFQLMKEEGCQLDTKVYTSLVCVYSRSGRLDKAFAILEEMKSISQCEPDVFTYSTLIKYCLEASMFKHVYRLLNEMHSRGIMPNTVTKNILIDGYGKAGMFDEMQIFLSQMLKDHTCKPDEWTMNVFLKVFGNRGEIDLMEKWYKRFQNMGIPPDIKTFEILIGSYAKERLYDKMAAVMEYMQKYSLLWTTKTYNVVIDAFGGEGEIEQMEFAFNQMRLEGVKPDSTTFCTLISAYGKAGFFDQITKVVQYTENSDVLPDTPFFNSVIEACRKTQNFTEMERVFKKMKDRGCIPDQVSFTTMMETYLSECMPEKVKELEQEMQSIKLAAV